MTNLMEALKKQKSILKSQGYSVAYICIYGSQNYGLDVHTDEYQSDIDMKAVIVPTLDDLVKDSKPVSKTINTEWGQCDVKDIRTYFQTLLKANPAYIETIFTDYYIVDEKFESEFKEIFSMRDDLVYTLRAQFIRAMYGMMCEKQKALKHPYPTIAHKIEKFGYDGKQLHHIVRLWMMMVSYFDKNLPLQECFNPPSIFASRLIDIKLNKLSLRKAEDTTESIMERSRGFKDMVLSNIDEKNIDYSIKNKFLELSQSIIKNKIIDECGGFVE